MYNAIVARIAVRPHPNADRLQVGVCSGNQVIVGLDTKNGELGLFFAADGQLSHEFCVANYLYSKSALEKLGMDVGGDQRFGFICHRRRVRCQTFRGEKSDGLWMPLSCVAYTGVDLSVLAEGDAYTHLNGQEVCGKYLTEATRQARAGRSKRKGVETAQFRRHVETEQLRHAAQLIPPGSILYFTEKLHGTSMRFGHVLETEPQTWWQRLLRRPAERTWRHLNGTRNTILDGRQSGFYGSEQFRFDVVAGLTLPKGLTIYGEIVGDVSVGKPIMPSHAIKDPVLQKSYGSVMSYRYGTLPGEHRVYVYRMTMTNEDGVGVELSWPQVKAKAHELGLPTVPDLGTYLYEFGGPFGLTSDEMPDALRACVEVMTEGCSTLDPSHIREGVVVRTESPDGRTTFSKLKSFNFQVLEGIIKDSDDYVDREEIS